MTAALGALDARQTFAAEEARTARPVAKLVATSKVRPQRVPGLMRGKLTIVAEDDEHLDGFKDYMP